MILRPLAIALTIIAFPTTVLAHDPYSGTRNPVTGAYCCNTRDCWRVPPTEIREEGANFLWRGMAFPKAQSLPSFDEHYHVCAPVLPWGAQRITCLFRPIPGA